MSTAISPTTRSIIGASGIIYDASIESWIPSDGLDSATLVFWGDASTTNWKTGLAQDNLGFANADPFQEYLGTSLDFDGASGSHIDLGSGLTLSGDFSISVWVNPDFTGSNGFLFRSAINFDHFLQMVNNSILQLTIDGNDNSFAVSITNNQWNHFLITRNGTDLRCWENGVESSTGTLTATTDDLIIEDIGRASGLTDNEQKHFALWNNDQSANVASIYSSTNIAPDITSLSPLHWWKMDEGTGTTVNDSGSGSLNGTLSGSMEWIINQNWNFDNGDKYLEFDGSDDYVDVSGITASTINSISGWINFSNALARYDAICSFGDGTTSNRVQFFKSNNGNLRLYVQTGGTVQYDAEITSPFTLNTWHHVVVTHNGTEPTIYIDGSSASISYSTDVDRTKWIPDLVGGDEAYLGVNNNSGFTQYLDGLEDDFVFTSDVITSGEVTSLYNSGNGADPTGILDNIVHYYDLNESAYSAKITDSGSGGADGDLVNFHSVNQLDDLSANANHAQQTTASSQPTIIQRGNERSIKFWNDNFKTTNNVNITGNDDFTVFFLERHQGTSTHNLLGGGGSYAAGDELMIRYLNSGNDLQYYDGGTKTKSSYKDSDVQKITNLECISYDSSHDAGIKFYENGNEVTGLVNGGTDTTINRTAGQWTIGARRGAEANKYYGEMIDVIIFSGTITEADRQIVEGYLAHKLNDQYGDATILTALDAGHPYKSTAPTA